MAAQVNCRRCATGVPIAVAKETDGYCRGCAPALPGMELAVMEQEEAASEYSGQELTRAMREPLADISERAGRIERSAPLFFGTGDNPTLF